MLVLMSRLFTLIKDDRTSTSDKWMCRQSTEDHFDMQVTTIFDTFGSSAYLAQLFSFVMRQKGSEALKSGVDTLHSTSLIRIGNLTSNSTLLVDNRSTRVAPENGLNNNISQEKLCNEMQRSVMQCK